MIAAGLTLALALAGASVREDWREVVLAESLDSPVSMTRAPDGRLFVCEQSGRVRVVRRGRLLPRPFVTVPAHARGEQGLLAVAFAPDFARSRHVFLYYTVDGPRPHNRVSRVTAAGDTALAGSERVVFELDPHPGPLHAGGGLAFGPDGMLYVGTGDGDAGGIAQDLHKTAGKLLRLDPRGGPAAGNPFDDRLAGRARAVWARGLRNAFSITVSARTGWMVVNDVGGAAFEEINEARAGADYGWPYVEGASAAGATRGPLHAYAHGPACAITGGTFHEPRRGVRSRWDGHYLFADLCRREIRALDPARPDTAVTVTTLSRDGPVDVVSEPDGSIVCLLRGSVSPEGGGGSAWGTLVRLIPDDARRKAVRRRR